MDRDKKLLIISGPTASGKTEISIELAKRLKGEIINADSMQVYKGMDIGTAKIKEEEKQGIAHHLFDICDPKENFDVSRYQEEAKKCIDGICERGHLPILVGGTGFYIQAVLYDIGFDENPPDPEYRKALENIARDEGTDVLHAKLREVDPDSADSIHPNNIKRVIRALEYHHQTGKSFYEHNQEQRKSVSPYTFLYAVLTLPRDVLYERIDRRVDLMMEEGLESEVRALIDSGVPEKCTAMQGLGYKEIAAYIKGDISLDKSIEILKRDTRHFAKRQLTWFKREKEVTWFDKSSYENEDKLIEDIIKKAGEKNVR